MLGFIILLVVGLLMLSFGIPLGALAGAAVAALVHEDATPFGFIIGWIIGILIAGTGLVIAILNAINIIQLLFS